MKPPGRPAGGKTKRVAETEEPPVVVPVVTHIEVQLAVRGVAVQIRHVAIAIRVHPGNVQDTAFATAPRILSGLNRIRDLGIPNLLVPCTK